jgi:hypothetical protein
MLPKDHDRKLRKLRILSKRLDRMIGNGSFYAQPFWRRYALVRKVKRLYGSLVGPISPATSRAILAGAAALALVACGSSGTSKADNPSFAVATSNTFGFVPIAHEIPMAPAFADIDADGDADLFAGAGGEGDGVIKYYNNAGTKTSPAFAAGAFYPDLPDATDYFTNMNPVPVLAPMTGGPNWDALIGHSQGGISSIEFYTNNGSEFSSMALPDGLPTDPGYLRTATVVDLNGDDKLDIIFSASDYDSEAGTEVNSIHFYKNTGIATAPLFTDQGSISGLVLPAGAYGYPTFVDINADGLYDAFVGNENGDIYYFKNIGTATAPAFAAPVKNPFGITALPEGTTVPAFVDIDADGDFDLFVGDCNGDLWFFENKDL